MRRANVAAAGFALAGGSAVDTTGVVHIAPLPDRFGRVLLACVEPLEHSPRGMELAAVALRAMRETFETAPGPCADALVVAFAAANAAVMAENRPLATGRWERRICVGATGIALAGREITVAQTAPSQAILVQDRQIYAFPDLASWRGDYAPRAPATETCPLGFAEDEPPRLYHSDAAPGDLIALCATSVGRVLGRDEDAVVELFGGSLLTGDLEGSVDRLERLVARHEVTDAFAVVASVSRLPGRSRVRTVLSHRRHDAEPGPAGAGSDARLLAAAVDVHSAPIPGIASPFLPAHEREVDRPPVFEGLRGWAIEFAELISASRREQTPAYDTRRKALAAPGALSVRRYRESSGLPPEWRANLPRGPGVHVPARLLAVSLLLFVALGGTGVAVGRQRNREALAENSLVIADAALRNAVENPGTAMSSVAEAERAVATAREAGATGAILSRREQELARVRDDVWGILRLGNVVRLGALPLEMNGGPVRLALSGRTLYLAAGNLYELDPEDRKLIALLSRGDDVDGVPAGDLRHVSIDGGDVVASDGAAAYRRDRTGRWLRQPLAVADIGGLRPDSPVITWSDASYGLSWDGDIVRFDWSSGRPLAENWAAVDETPDLELARDFAIDGRIHVLLEDGRTLTFSRGELVGTLSPFVVPAIDGPAFLADAPYANAFYIVDRSGAIGQNVGRIVQVDATGDARQYLAPAPTADDPVGSAAAVTLASAEDLAIDELSGTVYWVSSGEIWRANLPAA